MRRAIARRWGRSDAGGTLGTGGVGISGIVGLSLGGTTGCIRCCTRRDWEFVVGWYVERSDASVWSSLASVSVMSLWRSVACLPAGDDGRPARAALQLANASMSLSCGVIAGLVIDLWRKWTVSLSRSALVDLTWQLCTR